MSLFSDVNNLSSPDDSESWNEVRKKGIPKFWRRLGGRPSFSDLRILDLGCGGGYLSLDMVKDDAEKVVGIDIDEESIVSAKRRLNAFPELSERVEFLCMDLREYDPQEQFDLVISRDALEHIMNLEFFLLEVIKRMKPGGRLYVGFGPLWNSPYGGHGRMKMPLPWGHVLLPEKMLLRWVNLFYDEKYPSIEAMGLNKLALRDYERILLDNPELKVIRWKVNHEENLFSRLFARIARIPLLREYFSHDIYAVFEKM